MRIDVSEILSNAFNRLDKIKHNSNRKCGYSNVLLFKEYLRRLTELYILSTDERDFSPGCYLCLIKSKIEGFEDKISSLTNKNLSTKVFGVGGYVLVHHFLYWEVYKKLLPFELSPELIDLYEPLIRIFERGGSISRHTKVYDVCGARQSFTISPDYSKEPYLTDFTDAHLDYIDAIHRD